MGNSEAENVSASPDWCVDNLLAKKAAKAGNPCGLARTNPYVEPFVLKLPKPRSKQ